MPTPSTRERYAARIDKVVDYLVDHLDESLPLERLASIGHFSPWHFHRIYRGMMGETIQTTVERLRLQRAANELVHGRRTLDDIARDAGYASQAAFARAFTPAYGLPPGRFRQQGGIPTPLSTAPYKPPADGETYAVCVQLLDSIDVAALRHRGDYQRIGDAFQRLAAWSAGQGIAATEARSFGIYDQDPESVDVNALTSYACIEIPPALRLQPPLARSTIPSGRHAVLVHTGPYIELEHAYHWLYSSWLPSSGEEAADQPIVEEYLNDCQSLPPIAWQTAICLPLRQEASR